MRRIATISTVVVLALSACGSTADESPFASFTRGWRDDPVWHDGKAEYCLYDATRTIYGNQRHYKSRLFTNKELADPNTKTKSATDKGRAMFKHHLREDISTDNYNYHYSTMCYVGESDLKSLKLEVGSIEDCGSSLKQFVNHAGVCRWRQSSYFPNEGFRSGRFEPAKSLVYQDALSLVLRGYPFDDPPAKFEVRLLADQTSNKWSPVKRVPAFVTYVGKETLDLPIGRVEAHHVRVETAGKNPHQTHDYWFAASQDPPWLHVMVQYAGPGEITYKLAEHRRWAYWRHD